MTIANSIDYLFSNTHDANSRQKSVPECVFATICPFHQLRTSFATLLACPSAGKLFARSQRRNLQLGAQKGRVAICH